MKRLLLAAVFLLTAAPGVGGDLGLADHVLYGVDSKNPDFNRKSFQTSILYGSDGKGGRGVGKTVASFEDGLFKVTTSPEWVEQIQTYRPGMFAPNASFDENGISPEQVVSFDWHIEKGIIIFSVFYRDSEGKAQLATLGFNQNDSLGFKHAFLNWMSPSAAQSRPKPPAPAVDMPEKATYPIRRQPMQGNY